MKKILAIILVAVMLCSVLVGCKKEEPKETQGVGGGVGLVVDPNQGDYVAPEQQEIGGIAIPGWGEIILPPNQTDIVVDFYNPDKNKDKYYLVFELRLITGADQNKDYEVLYKSGLVEPGKHIQRITLSKSFEKGEYNAVMFVQPYKMDGTLTPTNNLNSVLKLVVK